jgi:hypothetical protein
LPVARRSPGLSLAGLRAIPAAKRTIGEKREQIKNKKGHPVGFPPRKSPGTDGLSPFAPANPREHPERPCDFAGFCAESRRALFGNPLDGNLLFRDSAGEMRREYPSDGLHLSLAGYRALNAALSRQVKSCSH